MAQAGKQVQRKLFDAYKATRGGTATLGKITVKSRGKIITQKVSSEFHHVFITQRMQRAWNIPNWLVNNRINVWKINTVQHAIMDSYRFQTMKAEIKPLIGIFKEYNLFTKF
jgi:hypothetical protein